MTYAEQYRRNVVMPIEIDGTAEAADEFTWRLEQYALDLATELELNCRCSAPTRDRYYQ